MKNCGLVIFLAVFWSHTYGQDSWGKVSKKQFSIRVCPFDSTANAMVLFDRCEITFKYDYGEFKAVYKRHKRIQLLNKQGFENANASILYYSFKDREMITDLRAQTLNPGADGTVQLTKVERKLIFDESVTDKISARKIAFPEISEGSIIEYDYTLESKSIRFLEDWIFQGNIPSLRSSITLKAPDFLQYVIVFESTIPIDEKTTDTYDESYPASFFGDSRYEGERRNVAGRVSSYALNNIPALKQEKYITAMEDYQAKISFVLSSVAVPNGRIESFAESWNSISDELLKSDDFGLYLNGFGDHLRIAHEITRNIPDKLQKIKIIYNEVVSKMKWNERFSMIPTGRLAKSYNDGTGNSADINMALIDMLRAAGIKSDPVLISTRDHGKVQKVYPDFSQFNHVIALAKTDSGRIFLDAISATHPWNLLSVSDLNSSGLQLEMTHADWVDIVPSKNSSSIMIYSVELDSAENVIAKGNVIANDYEAFSYRSGLKDMSIKECLKDNLALADEAEIISAKVENQNELDKRLKVTFELNKAGKGTMNDVIYLNPFPLKFRKDNPFVLKKRTYPVNFGYPFEESIKLSIKIPSGYKVSEIPKSVNLKLDDGSASFIFLAGQSESNIQISSTLKISRVEYQPEMYESLKSLFAGVNDIYKSLIVLEKL